MAADRVLAALIAQRQVWVPLPGGGEVRVRRPAEAEFAKFTRGVAVDHVCEYVDGWRNVTEAVLLGDTVGADDAVDFSPELWSAWVRDNVPAIEAVAKAISEAIGKHIQSRKAAAGN